MHKSTQNAPRGQSRSQAALIHRGPQAMAGPHSMGLSPHAPNAALLIDFDNVTMGIRSDLGKELRSLLSSEIIKGKVAVQRAYADWRRYPQYIVPLSEASIDLIFAPAYGSSKKNATDIRLAIDALELVFTRPEIGTFILLSGDSDFSSLVIKLKEYGKYVIGVGIRESSSDLLVQNCDEYYSYNALAGLVRASEDEPTRKFDPWELVTEAVTRMKRNGDVMRSDRLKQVMQEIDATFDEKNLGIAKFSRFCQEAAQRGLLAVTKLENGQLEVDLPVGGETRTRADVVAVPTPVPAAPAAEKGEANGQDERRRGRRGRGRGRGERGGDRERTAAGAEAPPKLEVVSGDAPAAASTADAGISGERLTRAEAFDLVRQTLQGLGSGNGSVKASELRARARDLLGRDSESLQPRMFERILKDAHDGGVIDLRRRGNDFEVSLAADADSVADQLARAEAKAKPAAVPAASGPRMGMGPRGSAGRGRGRPGAAPPPELLSIGVVAEAPRPAAAQKEAAAEEAAAPKSRAKKTARKTGARKAVKTVEAESGDGEKPAKGRRGSTAKAAGSRPRKPRAKAAAKQAPEQ